MLRWAREDNKRDAGDAECQEAYGDNDAMAKEQVDAPGRMLGIVTPTHID